MECKQQTALELPHHKLLSQDECPYGVNSGRENRQLFTFANVLKSLAVLTVLAACATSVTCAVYCNRTLSQVRILREDVIGARDSVQAARADGDLKTAPVAERLTGGSNGVLDDLVRIDDGDDFDSDDALDEADDNDDDDEIFDDEDESQGDDESDDASSDEDGDDDDDYDEYDYDDTRDDDDSDISEGIMEGGLTDIDDGLDEEGDASGMVPDDENHGRFRRSTREDKKKRNNKKNRDNKKRKNKKGKSRNKKLKSLPTAQFTANMTEKDLMMADIGHDAYELKDDCNYATHMNGILCRNKTFIPDSRRPLRVFKKDVWVDNKKSPLTMKDKQFIVNDDGTHLVYAQILFEGKYHPVSASIVREARDSTDTERRLTCTNDCINTDRTLQCTCSIFGLMNLKKDDKLHFEVNNGENSIIFEESATYMGIVQLNRD